MTFRLSIQTNYNFKHALIKNRDQLIFVLLETSMEGAVINCNFLAFKILFLCQKSAEFFWKLFQFSLHFEPLYLLKFNQTIFGSLHTLSAIFRFCAAFFQKISKNIFFPNFFKSLSKKSIYVTYLIVKTYTKSDQNCLTSNKY